MTDWPWYAWVLLVTIGGPVAMIGCAWLGLWLYFFLEPPLRCPDCQDPMPTHYAGRRYTGERCPACEVVASVKKGARV